MAKRVEMSALPPHGIISNHRTNNECNSEQYLEIQLVIITNIRIWVRGL